MTTTKTVAKPIAEGSAWTPSLKILDSILDEGMWLAVAAEILANESRKLDTK